MQGGRSSDDVASIFGFQPRFCALPARCIASQHRLSSGLCIIENEKTFFTKCIDLDPAGFKKTTVRDLSRDDEPLSNHLDLVGCAFKRDRTKVMRNGGFPDT
jgi:hypothetical protein